MEYQLQSCRAAIQLWTRQTLPQRDLAASRVVMWCEDAAAADIACMCPLRAHVPPWECGRRPTIAALVRVTNIQLLTFASLR